MTPAEPAPAGGGRLAAYCDRSDHSPTSAFRARQQAQEGTDGEGEVEAGPLSAALAELDGVRGELGAQLASHHHTLSRMIESALEALSTVADPSQVEAERHALAAEADAAARRETAEAITARDEAAQRAERTETARAAPQADADRARSEAGDERERRQQAEQREASASQEAAAARSDRDAALAAQRTAEHQAAEAPAPARRGPRRP